MLGLAKTWQSSQFISQVRSPGQSKGKSFAQIFMMSLSCRETGVSKGEEGLKGKMDKQEARLFHFPRVQGLPKAVNFLTPRVLSNVCIFRDCFLLVHSAFCTDALARPLLEHISRLPISTCHQHRQTPFPEALPKGPCFTVWDMTGVFSHQEKCSKFLITLIYPR